MSPGDYYQIGITVWLLLIYAAVLRTMDPKDRSWRAAILTVFITGVCAMHVALTVSAVTRG